MAARGGRRGGVGEGGGVTADKYTVSSGSKVNVLELMVMVVQHCEYAELLNYILHMGEQQQKKKNLPEKT